MPRQMCVLYSRGEPARVSAHAFRRHRGRNGPRSRRRAGTAGRGCDVCGAGVRQRPFVAFHRLPRATAADLLSRAECKHRHRRRAWPTTASRRRRDAEALRYPGAHAGGARLYLSRVCRGGQGLRQDGWLRASRNARQTTQGEPARRFAARWRRHLAGVRDRPVDAGAGHDRRREATRRRHHDRSLGIHLRRRARQAGGGRRLQGRHRIRRAEREDSRLRRPGISRVHDARAERCADSDHRPGVPLYADRQSTLLRTGLDVRYPRRGDAEGRRRDKDQGRATGCACCRTTAWTST